MWAQQKAMRSCTASTTASRESAGAPMRVTSGPTRTSVPFDALVIGRPVALDVNLEPQFLGGRLHGRDQLESICKRDDEPAVETIGDLSTGHQQHDERQELREPDEPQVFLFAGQLPHLVAEDHVDHLPGQRRGESAVRVAREIGMAQCLAAGRSCVADQSRRMEGGVLGDAHFSW